MSKISFQIVNNTLLVSVPTWKLPAKKAEDYCKEVALLFEDKKEIMGVDKVIFLPYHDSTGEHVVELIGSLIVIHLPVGNMPLSQANEFIARQQEVVGGDNVVILPYRNITENPY